MDENVQVAESSVVQEVTPEVSPAESSAGSSVEVAADTPSEKPKEEVKAEKMIPQSQVSKIAAREARQAAEKARRDMQAEFDKQQVQQQAGMDTGSAPSQMGGIPQMTQEQLEQHILAAAQKMSTHMTAKKMAEDFESKIKAEIEADPDFGDLYDQLNIEAHPELVIWMNGMDNSAKVVKELAQNPTKFANILMLAKSGMGALAQKALKEASESIKTNQKALAEPKVNEPLDQLSPSSIGVDNGQMSVSDYMKQSWLRG